MERMNSTGVATCRTRGEKMPRHRSVRLFETRWHGWAIRAGSSGFRCRGRLGFSPTSREPSVVGLKPNLQVPCLAPKAGRAPARRCRPNRYPPGRANGDEPLGARVCRGEIGNLPNWRPSAGPSRRSQRSFAWTCQGNRGNGRWPHLPPTTGGSPAVQAVPRRYSSCTASGVNALTSCPRTQWNTRPLPYSLTNAIG
jgi:hypothetical protein